MSSPKRPSHGVAYSVRDDHIRAFLRLSPTQRLQHVEDLEELLAQAMTPGSKRVREMFRKDEI